MPSTVIDLSSGQPELLRQGAGEMCDRNRTCTSRNSLCSTVGQVRRA